jgi:glycosyltransferase involved in cell wall biosynthesis
VIGIADGGPIARRIGADARGNRAGITVPTDDQVAVARALGTLADPVTRERLGRVGQVRAKGHPDAHTVAARFAAVLAETANRPGAGLCTGPAISVVSPVLDEAPNIDRLIAPIAAQLGPDDEYLLVDGGSTDGTRELIEAWTARDDRIVLVRSPGGTIANSRNRGIAAAGNDFIACTDAGCDPGPDWLAGFRAAAAESLASDEAPGLFVGVYGVGIRGGSRFEQAMAAVSWPDPEELRRRTPLRRAYARLFGRAFSPRRVDGRSVGFRKSAWEAAGGFPEHLRTAEDEAFGRAVIASGTRSALTLDAAVTWHQRTSARATFEQFRGYGRGGGTSRSGLLLGRDAVRTAAYLGAGIALARGGTAGKLLAAAGAAAYLSVPVSRVIRRRQSPLILPLLPACILLKDAAKVAGTAEALLKIGKARPATANPARQRPTPRTRPRHAPVTGTGGTVARTLPTAPPVRRAR